MGKGPISTGVVKAWAVLALLGGLRMYVTLLVLAAAFLVFGNTPGRIIGVALLLLAILWTGVLVRERRAERAAKTP